MIKTYGASKMSQTTFVDGADLATVRAVINSNATDVTANRADGIVIVKVAADFGTVDSTKVYYIDGIIDMGATSVEIPAGGINIVGSTFDVSQLTSTENSYDMFTSVLGGCGNVLASDIGFTVSGVSSQVWNLTSDTGDEAFEFARINYNNCTKVGTLTNFRQGLELGTGRFGGTPTIELVGVWSGGFRITTSIVRSLSAGMTDPLFKAGAGFTMASRFLTDINCDLPTSAAFTDFAPSQFANPSTVQVSGAIFSRNGAFDAEDANIFPNMPATALASSFVGNKGITNTFVGGRNQVTTEVETTITTQDVFETLLGTFTTSGMAHFDAPSNGQLRHLGDNPREFRFISNLTIVGPANDECTIRLRKCDNSASSFVDVNDQVRQVNALTGGRNVAFFTIIEDIILDQNDYIFLQVANGTGTGNFTAEIDGYCIASER